MIEEGGIRGGADMHSATAGRTRGTYRRVATARRRAAAAGRRRRRAAPGGYKCHASEDTEQGKVQSRCAKLRRARSVE